MNPDDKDQMDSEPQPDETIDVQSADADASIVEDASFAANDPPRIVALKMILAGEFAGDEEVQRFHSEAEAAEPAILGHRADSRSRRVSRPSLLLDGIRRGLQLADLTGDGPLDGRRGECGEPNRPRNADESRSTCSHSAVVDALLQH